MATAYTFHPEATTVSPASLTPPVLISSHLGLVRKVAWQVHGRVSRAIEVEDLVQIGMVALIEAAHHFEVRPGASFATYAAIRVRGAMIDELRRQAHMTRGMLMRRKQVEAARRQLSRADGQAPSDAELARHLGIEASSIARHLDEARGVRFEALDDSLPDHSPFLADTAENQAEALERADTERALAEQLKQLPEREALVLQLYFIEELNLEDIGHILGVGAARVCQIKKSALERLRTSMAAIAA